MADYSRKAKIGDEDSDLVVSVLKEKHVVLEKMISIVWELLLYPIITSFMSRWAMNTECIY